MLKIYVAGAFCAYLAAVSEHPPVTAWETVKAIAGLGTVITITVRSFFDGSNERAESEKRAAEKTGAETQQAPV